MDRKDSELPSRISTLVRLDFKPDIQDITTHKAWYAMLAAIKIEPNWRFTNYGAEIVSGRVVLLVIGWKDGNPSPMFRSGTVAPLDLEPLFPIMDLLSQPPQVLNIGFYPHIRKPWQLSTFRVMEKRAVGIVELMVLAAPKALQADVTDISDTIGACIYHERCKMFAHDPDQGALTGYLKGWEEQSGRHGLPQGCQTHVILLFWASREERQRVKDPSKPEYYGDWFENCVHAPLSQLEGKGLVYESVDLHMWIARAEDGSQMLDPKMDW